MIPAWGGVPLPYGPYGYPMARVAAPFVAPCALPFGRMAVAVPAVPAMASRWVEEPCYTRRGIEDREPSFIIEREYYDRGPEREYYDRSPEREYYDRERDYMIERERDDYADERERRVEYFDDTLPVRRERVYRSRAASPVISERYIRERSPSVTRTIYEEPPRRCYSAISSPYPSFVPPAIVASPALACRGFVTPCVPMASYMPRTLPLCAPMTPRLPYYSF